MAATTAPMTTEEFLALPDDGTERWLIAGKLHERPSTTSKHPYKFKTRFHCFTMTCLAAELEMWRRTRPEPRGQALTGDAGVRLGRTPDTTFGVDVIYVSAELLARQTGTGTLIEGPPTLAAEILSPSDTIDTVHEKVTAFLDAGVPLVWILDPYQRTVIVHRPDAEPELVNVRQELSGEPHLPGFRIEVRRLFA